MDETKEVVVELQGKVSTLENKLQSSKAELLKEVEEEKKGLLGQISDLTEQLEVVLADF